MKTFNRRSFMAATAAVAAGTAAEARECTKDYDWQTMSLDARNAAFNNVAHVGPDIADRKPKPGPRSRPSSASSVRNISIWVTVKRGGPSGHCIPRPIPRRHALFTSTVDIGSAAAGRYLPVL